MTIKAEEWPISYDEERRGVDQAYRLGNEILQIIIDEDPHNPRDWDNLGTMVCFHNQYNLGDDHKYGTPRDFLETLAEELGMRPRRVDNATLERLLAYIEKRAVILPVHLYDHSGLTMNTTGFSCPWDSGQVGWIYATHETVRKDHQQLTADILATATRVLQDEVNVYDQFLQGDVYGYNLCAFHGSTGPNGDSCWGFFGHDIFENGIIENLPSNWQETLKVLLKGGRKDAAKSTP